MSQLKDAHRIVVKVGTSSLTHAAGKVNLRMFSRLAAVGQLPHKGVPQSGDAMCLLS